MYTNNRCTNCGCQGGCFQPNPTVTLSGRVIGSGGSVAGLTIGYTVDGVAYSTTTNGVGRYMLTAPTGALVVITPQPGLGVTVNPPSYTLRSLRNRNDLSFTLTPVTLQ